MKDSSVQNREITITLTIWLLLTFLTRLLYVLVTFMAIQNPNLWLNGLSGTDWWVCPQYKYSITWYHHMFCACSSSMKSLDCCVRFPLSHRLREVLISIYRNIQPQNEYNSSRCVFDFFYKPANIPLFQKVLYRLPW